MNSTVLCVVLTLAGCATAPVSPESGARVDATVRALTPRVNACYSAALAQQPQLEGRLVFELTFDAEGRPLAPRLVEDGLDAPVVAACASSVFAGMAADPALAGRHVALPFSFAPTRTLAVLPFQDSSKDPSTEWLRTGLPEILMTRLGTSPRLVIVDRIRLDAVLREHALAQAGVIDEKTMPQLGQLVGADVLLVGSIHRLGEKLVLTARLVDTASGRVRGSADVNGTANELLDLQEALATKLFAQLNVAPTRPQATQVSTALVELLGSANLALIGVGAPADPKKAEVLFRRATTQFPAIAEGWLGLVRALWAQGGDRKEITACLERAIELRPDSHEALSLQGFNLWKTGERRAEALALHQRALELKPDYGWGYFGLALNHATLGQGDEAIALNEHAASLLPAEPEVLSSQGLYLAVFHPNALEDAQKWADRASAMPASGEWESLNQAFVAFRRSDAPRCLESVARGVSKRASPEESRWIDQSRALEVACLALSGRNDEAKAAFANHPEPAQLVQKLRAGAPADLPAFEKFRYEALASALEPFAP